MAPTNQITDSSTIKDAHDHSCICPLCAQPTVCYTPEKGLRFQNSDELGSIEPFRLQTKQSFARSDVSDPESYLRPSSPPSMGSAGSKRSWFCSDDEDSDTGSDYSNKRFKRHSSSSSEHERIYLPRSDDTFFNFCNRPGTVFVDKTQCLSSLPARFRYILLRPPRFGKTTFVTTLVEYYDIHRVGRFLKNFGTLAAVANAPETIHHERHLCLSFNLRDLSVYSTVKVLADDIRDTISSVLSLFVTTYSTELGVSLDDHSFLDFDTFESVYELVRARNYTMLVTVDDFDGPFRTWSSVDSDILWGRKNMASPQDVVEVLNTRFWDPLFAGSDIIHKLFVTGVLLPEYSFLQQRQFTTPASLSLSCGFSEREADQFIVSILGETVDLAELQHGCGGYVFPSEGPVDDATPIRLLHPQRCIEWIRQRARPGENDRGSFQLLSDILEVLPEESEDANPLTASRLIELLATGIVAIDPRVDALINCDPKAPTWAALYYAGALTPDPQRPDTYRIANGAALFFIHSRVDRLFAERHRLEWTYFDAWLAFCRRRPDPELFLGILSGVLRDQAQRCLSNDNTHEPNLHGIFELIMRNNQTGGHNNEPIILHSDVARVQVRKYFPPEELLTLDLKTVTLLGMWRGQHPNDDRTPTIQELRELHDELRTLDDATISERPCRVWSPTLQAMETMPVGRFLPSNPQHPQFLAVGGDRVLASLPPRVATEDEDDDDAEVDDEDIEVFDEWNFDDVVEEERFVAQKANDSAEEEGQTFPDEYY